MRKAVVGRRLFRPVRAVRAGENRAVAPGDNEPVTVVTNTLQIVLGRLGQKRIP